MQTEKEWLRKGELIEEERVRAAADAAVRAPGGAIFQNAEMEGKLSPCACRWRRRGCARES